jgi:cytochrome c-type biogenesis protein CcmF
MLVSRHRQRYGGYLVHLGLILLAVGIIGSHFFQVEQDLSLTAGKSARVDGYQITYDGISGSVQNSVQVIKTHFTLARGGQHLADIYPGEKIFPGFASQPTSIVSITTTGVTDFYVFLSGYEGATSAQLKVFINPLVPLVWLGGILMLLGGVICWWPAAPSVGPRRSGGGSVRQREPQQPVTADAVEQTGDQVSTEVPVVPKRSKRRARAEVRL